MLPQLHTATRNRTQKNNYNPPLYHQITLLDLMQLTLRPGCKGVIIILKNHCPIILTSFRQIRKLFEAPISNILPRVYLLHTCIGIFQVIPRYLQIHLHGFLFLTYAVQSGHGSILFLPDLYQPLILLVKNDQTSLGNIPGVCRVA